MKNVSTKFCICISLRHYGKNLMGASKIEKMANFLLKVGPQWEPANSDPKIEPKWKHYAKFIVKKANRALTAYNASSRAASRETNIVAMRFGETLASFCSTNIFWPSCGNLGFGKLFTAGPSGTFPSHAVHTRRETAREIKTSRIAISTELFISQPKSQCFAPCRLFADSELAYIGHIFWLY